MTTWFSRLRSWVTDSNNGIGIRADNHDSEDNNFATGINACLNIAGLNSPTANISWGSNKITSLLAGSALTDAVNVSQLALETGIWCGSSTGSANAYVLTPSPAISAYTTGMRFTFLANFSNSGTTTVNISGLGAKNITKLGATALSGNEIISGMFISIGYDGTEFQLLQVQIPLPLTAKGDLLGFDGSANQRLAVGTNTYILTADSSQTLGVKWGAGPLTTKGDVFCFDTAAQRLAVGTNGQALTAQSGQTTGLQWATIPPLASSYVTVGTDSTLTGYRKLTSGSGVVLTDGGAAGNITIKTATGAVIQTQTTTLTTSSTIALTQGTWTDAGLSVTITPTSSSSTVFISATLQADPTVATSQYAFYRLMRGSTPICVSTDQQASQLAATGCCATGNSSGSGGPFVVMFQDSPATTSATTYKMQVAPGASSNIYINRSQADTNSNAFCHYASTITAQELSA